jgi:hypothetical protein
MWQGGARVLNAPDRRPDLAAVLFVPPRIKTFLQVVVGNLCCCVVVSVTTESRAGVQFGCFISSCSLPTGSRREICGMDENKHGYAETAREVSDFYSYCSVETCH